MLHSNTVYWSFTFENRIESTNFIKFPYKLNEMRKYFTATEARFLPIIPTQNRLPDSILPTNTDSAISHHRCDLCFDCISCYQSRLCHSLISVSFCSTRTTPSSGQAWRTLAIRVGAESFLDMQPVQLNVLEVRLSVSGQQIMWSCSDCDTDNAVSQVIMYFFTIRRVTPLMILFSSCSA